MELKKIFFVFLFCILLSSAVLAVEIEVKDSVKLGENFIVKISGTFSNPIQEDQVKFFRQGHIPTEMGEVDIIEIEGDYYFYLAIPLEKLSDNYTITIEDVKYKSGTKYISSDISSNFYIENKTAPFSITPPLIISSQKYEVEVQNLLDKKINIELEKKIKPIETIVLENETNETIVDEETKESFFDIFFNLFSPKNNESQNESQENVSLITGQVIAESPIVLKSGETKILTFNAPKEKGFEKLELYYDYEGYGVLVYNPEGEKEITEENETNDTIETPLQNETIELNESITLPENSSEETNFTNIDITENGTIINKTTNETICTTKQTCSECGGKICTPQKEICLNNEKVWTKTNYCCLSECVPIKKVSTGKIIGWAMIIAIVLFLAWFFKEKYLHAGTSKIDLVSIAQGKKD